ncbi:flagellar protein FlgN [Aeromonas caviae]|uniref:flagellar protein FlgN n=1 Tax=Aeromonas caviae TaxID=648 RepID=UPI002DBE8371|nr:flagellar protein FlgN [Aeromonas caviae]MEB5773261.1 flagellar protein FlgN [Aeromonas caviae]MEB6648483.1 flagellar protein FlgN [Aeromonas caviae]
MTMTPRLRVQQLIVGIQQDCGRYAELQQLLLNQYRLLASHDVDGLTAHNQQQTRVMSEIQQQVQLRCQHLRALGLKPDEQGMATLIGKLPAPLQQRVGEQWQTLELLLRQCQRQNEQNGRLLAGQIETIHTLLGQESSYGRQEHFPD